MATIGPLGSLSAVGAALLIALVGCKPSRIQAGPAPAGTDHSPHASAAAHEATPIDFPKLVKERRDQLRADEAGRKQTRSRLGFKDDASSALCVAEPATDPATIDVHKSLWIHDRATLDAADFSLTQTLGRLASQANDAGAVGLTATGLFTKLMDTQNGAPGVTSGAHCTDDGGKLNGYPIHCRGEGAQASDAALQITKYHAIGLVNRLDLAHEGFQNCGEHRIVYGRTDASTTTPLGRAFVIFEAVLPNPKPGCRSACEPVAQFWRELSEPALSNTERATRLHDFFYVGLPGFDPVVRFDHYTADGTASRYGSSGGGQIRTNTFVSFPWTLKEFRLAFGCETSGCDLDVVPTMVKVNPFARLFSERLAASTQPFHAEAAAFQAQFVASIDSLAVKGPSCPGPGGPDINRIGYSVSLPFDAGESPSSPFDIASNPVDGSYSFNFRDLGSGFSLPPLGGGFRTAVATSSDACGLSSEQLVARAQAQSCAGCHQPNAFSPTDIGTVTLPDGSTTSTWPASLGFVHVRETAVAGVHELSPALVTAFLPERKRVMLDVLAQPTCPCRETFALLEPPERERAVKLEDIVTKRLEPRIREERRRFELTAKKPASAARTKELQRLHAKLRDLDAQRDKELDRALKEGGVEMPPVVGHAKPAVLRLNPSQEISKDPMQLTALRRKAVLDSIRAAPPRRTVTGSFRVH